MAFRRRDNETRQTSRNYEHFAGMDLDTMPEKISSDPAIRNAVLQSRQALRRRSARHEQPQERPSLRDRFGDRFDRIIRSRKSKYAGMAMFVLVTIGASLALTDSDTPGTEAAFQRPGAVPTMPEATTTTLITTTTVEPQINTENPAAPESAAITESTKTQTTVTEQKITIQAGGTLWWEIGDIFNSAGLTDGDCIEIATRGIVNALSQTTGRDLNNLQPGPQDFGVNQQQIDNELQVVAAQNPHCSVIA